MLYKIVKCAQIDSRQRLMVAQKQEPAATTARLRAVTLPTAVVLSKSDETTLSVVSMRFLLVCKSNTALQADKCLSLSPG